MPCLSNETCLLMQLLVLGVWLEFTARLRNPQSQRCAYRWRAVGVHEDVIHYADSLAVELAERASREDGFLIVTDQALGGQTVHCRLIRSGLGKACLLKSGTCRACVPTR